MILCLWMHIATTDGVQSRYRTATTFGFVACRRYRRGTEEVQSRYRCYFGFVACRSYRLGTEQVHNLTHTTSFKFVACRRYRKSTHRYRTVVLRFVAYRRYRGIQKGYTTATVPYSVSHSRPTVDIISQL